MNHSQPRGSRFCQYRHHRLLGRRRPFKPAGDAVNPPDVRQLPRPLFHRPSKVELARFEIRVAAGDAVGCAIAALLQGMQI